jgi:putative transcription factor
MLCELCGRLSKEVFRVEVEGSTVVACAGCAKLGKVVERIVKEAPRKPAVQVKPKPDEVFEVSDGFEVREDFAERIRKARENMNLKQGDLAKAVNEPESLIHRIESGRIVPSPLVARKIEKKLDVVLFEKSSASGASVGGKSAAGGVTLGDVVVLRKRS